MRALFVRKKNIMADQNERLNENVPGKYYVTSLCIDCDLCRESAPTVFKRNDEIGFSIAFRQPETEAEKIQAEEAMSGCPVEAIGNDGPAQLPV